MSRLGQGNEDHPDAATKHFADARALLTAGRHDGAAYLSGYVLECALKAVVLHDQSWDSVAGTHDPAKLSAYHTLLKSKPYGHKLLRIQGIALQGDGARYAIDLPRDAKIFEWQETLRYSPTGTTDKATAHEYGLWAEHAHEQSILRMRLDGVL